MHNKLHQQSKINQIYFKLQHVSPSNQKAITNAIQQQLQLDHINMDLQLPGLSESITKTLKQSSQLKIVQKKIEHDLICCKDQFDQLINKIQEQCQKDIQQLRKRAVQVQQQYKYTIQQSTTLEQQNYESIRSHYIQLQQQLQKISQKMSEKSEQLIKKYDNLQRHYETKIKQIRENMRSDVNLVNTLQKQLQTITNEISHDISLQYSQIEAKKQAKRDQILKRLLLILSDDIQTN